MIGDFFSGYLDDQSLWFLPCVQTFINDRDDDLWNERYTHFFICLKRYPNCSGKIRLEFAGSRRRRIMFGSDVFYYNEEMK